MKALTGVLKVDLGVGPGPRALVCFVVPNGGAQDHDVSKEPPVGAFEQIQDIDRFSTSRLPAYYRRMSAPGEQISMPLKRTGHL